ncbi:MAG: hypothetical protein RLZZ244_2793 [Verrucomicrobiota bacterium]|jgi:hypothetical protein
MKPRLFPVLAGLLSPLCLSAKGSEISFNRDIRPILSENCFYCHGQDGNKRKGGLRLDERDGALQKGESGEVAVVPGNPEASALVSRIFSKDQDEQMPPVKSNRHLTEEQRDLLKRWVAAGAPYEKHWAFVAPVRPALPEVGSAEGRGWVRNPIDRFVFAKLEASGLRPTEEASRPTLIRRLSLDLTGLPPTPEEVDAFVADSSPQAYERVVERLLASPHYGERMALPWLDAARYADSNGFQQDGDTFQWVWRDWVVKALNADMPFDQFSIEQLAGDLLPQPTKEQLVATAFNRNHLLNGEGGAIAEEQRFNILFDRIDTTATNWLGLTMACAQCHDHKYDPITQRDYYGLLHAFNQVSENGLAGGGGRAKRIAPPMLEIASDEDSAKLEELKQKRLAAETAGMVAAKKDLAFAAWMAGASPDMRHPRRNDIGLPANLSAILRIKESERTAAQKKDLEKGMRDLFERDLWPKIAKTDPTSKEAEEYREAYESYKSDRVPRVMIMKDDKARETFVLNRGEYLQPREKVGFATPAFLPAPGSGTPANRLGFARWLFQADHPLTARVQVNRMWQLFFGTGFVKTSEDLGVQSEIPVHQELFDWLSVEFREAGWSMKHLHRLIVCSATYRQASRVSPELIQRDPENRLMARGARFRASALILRDAALAASGLLERRVGGQPVYPYQPEGVWETLAITKERDFTYPASSGPDLYRRSLYTFWRRTLGPTNMFDASNRQTCKVRQAATNTPLHALTTLNDPTWAEAARVLAARGMEERSETRERLEFVFRRVLGRRPAAADLELLERAYGRQLALFGRDPEAAASVTKAGQAPVASVGNVAEHAALSAVCLAILNLDEALTRE